MGSPFDREKLMRRARERLARRAVVDGRVEAELQHAIDYISIISLERVIDWLNGKGFTVEFSNGISSYSPAVSKIYITAKVCPEHQLYLLLHECGHYLIDHSKIKRYLYPNGYAKIEDRAVGRDMSHKVDVIGEEYDAWIRGLRLAGRLGISIRREEFDRIKAKAISSYFRWALKRGPVID